MDKAKQNQLADSICKAIEAPLAKGIASVFQFCENSTEELRKAHEAAMQDLISKHADEVAELKRQLDEAAKGGAVPSAAPKATKPTIKSAAIKHVMFDKIAACVKADKPLYLCGPAGCGKTQMCQMIAEELGLDFYMTAKVDDQFGIIGYMDGHGKFNETQFYKAMKYGGLFLFDEFDASDNNAVVAVNTAIANKYMVFPNGEMVKAHENFRILAAGNTFGTGADEQYAGRNVLDAASIDRFGYKFVDYDERVELVCAKGNKEIVAFVHDLRLAMKKARISPFTISYRGITNLVAFEEMFGTEEAVQMAITKGLDNDNVKNLYRNMECRNKYAKAFGNSATAYANAA